jgi:ABC-2 type transport system ATP-binding protein
VIEVRNLTRRYGQTVALDDVSFTVERGHVVGFLGPNGAGKTTAMRILAGYMPATSGSAAISGHDVHTDSLEARRHIGYLSEGVPLYPEMRVQEYLAYRAQIKAVPRRERRARIEEAMRRCDIADARRKLIGALSKGYRQRVGLAEALLSDPPVLILDEPTIGLDPNQIRHVRDLIRDLGKDHTILLSTHILPEVEMVCERVIIIHNGRLLFEDALARIGRGAESGKVIVEVRAPAVPAAKAFRAVQGVRNVHARAEGDFTLFEISADPAADVREEVHRAAVRNGWPLRELHAEQPSLEEIFVRLTAMDITQPEP